MKTANKIFYSVVFAKLLAIGLVVFAATSQSKLNDQVNSDNNLTQTTATTIDHASAMQIQTVLISTNRLTLEEKLAMDLERTRTLHANVQYNKKIRKIASSEQNVTVQFSSIRKETMSPISRHWKKIYTECLS